VSVAKRYLLSLLMGSAYGCLLCMDEQGLEGYMCEASGGLRLSRHRSCIAAIVAMSRILRLYAGQITQVI
jgi:hypothetical protein